MIITVDGPAGSGKSTVSKLLANRLGYLYLDSGAMYRAVAWAIKKERSEKEERDITSVLYRLPLRFSIHENELRIFYGDLLLGEELRKPEIAKLASQFSQLAPVRYFLTEWQRNLAKGKNVVAEGRDMATVVFPEAEVKIFLTADPSIRALRRFMEYRERGIERDLASIRREIVMRDRADEGRDLAPLKPAPDAYVLDTSNLDIDQVVDRLLKLIEEKNSEIK